MVKQVDGKVAGATPLAWRAPPAPFEMRSGVWRRPQTLAMGGLALALGLGLLARLRHILASGFPLNDGGMFYSMVRDLQASHYLLPSHTSYNSLHIPFAYPPFPFYLAAAIADVTHASLTDVFRFLPLAANMLTIIVVFYLARSLLGSRAAAPELAAIIFALLPRGYRWLIMGGGLTRSLGFLFALLAIQQTYLLYRQRKKRYFVGAALCGALTVLSHPEVAWYLGYSFATLVICYGRRRTALLDSLSLFAAVILVTAPWWATALARDGLAPFLSAARTGGQSWDVWRAFLSWDFTELSSLNWPAVLAMLGAVICIAQGELFLPAWLVVSVVLEPRSGPTYTTVPVSILSALAIVRFVLPLAKRPLMPAAGGAVAIEAAPVENRSILLWVRESGPLIMTKTLPMCAVGLFLFYLAFLSVRGVLQADPLLVGLTRQDRAAFQWVHTNTPADSKFLVVTGNFNPFADEVSEWFPALTKRQSVATLQGYEWLGEGRYYRQWEGFYTLQACQDSYCLDSWMIENASDATYVYVARNCCDALQQSLRSAYNYSLQYNGASAAIFVRRS